MDAQDFRSLQEVYNEVYGEGYKPWDLGPKQKSRSKYFQLKQNKEKEVASGVPGGKGTATRANRIFSVAKDMRTTLDRDSTATGVDPKRQGLQPSTQRHTAAAMRGAGGGITARKAYEVKRLLSKEDLDIYDIILSHLLDEGYADTQQAAEVIMVNMSEDWRESIVEEMLDEGEKPLPYGRMMKKSNQLADKGEGKRAAKIYLAANAPKGPKVKVRK